MTQPLPHPPTPPQTGFQSRTGPSRTGPSRARRRIGYTWLLLPFSLGLLGLGALSAQAGTSRFYLDPTIDGKAIWPCTHSDRYEQACSGRAVAKAAEEFCVTQGYMGAAEHYVESVEFPWERISVVGWTERLEDSGKIWRGWEDKGERYDRFSMVECRDY